MTTKISNELYSMEASMQEDAKLEELWSDHIVMLKRAAAVFDPTAVRQLQDINLGIYTKEFVHLDYLMQDFIENSTYRDALDAGDIAYVAAMELTYNDQATVGGVVRTHLTQMPEEFQSFDELASFPLETPEIFKFDKPYTESEKNNKQKFNVAIHALVSFKQQVKIAKRKLADIQMENVAVQQALEIQKQQNPALVSAIVSAEEYYQKSVAAKSLIDENVMTQGIRSIINYQLSSFVDAQKENANLINFNNALVRIRPELVNINSTNSADLKALQFELDEIKDKQDPAFMLAEMQVKKLAEAVTTKVNIKKMIDGHQNAKQQKKEVKKARKNLLYKAHSFFKNTFRHAKLAVNAILHNTQAKEKIQTSTVDNAVSNIAGSFITFLKFDGSYTATLAKIYAEKTESELFERITTIIRQFSEELSTTNASDNQMQLTLGRVYLQTLLMKIKQQQNPNYFQTSEFQADMKSAATYWEKYCVEQGVTAQIGRDNYSQEDFGYLQQTAHKLILENLPAEYQNKTSETLTAKEKVIKIVKDNLASASFATAAMAVAHLTPTKLDDIAVGVASVAVGVFGPRAVKGLAKVSKNIYGMFSRKSDAHAHKQIQVEENVPSNKSSIVA